MERPETILCAGALVWSFSPASDAHELRLIPIDLNLNCIIANGHCGMEHSRQDSPGVAAAASSRVCIPSLCSPPGRGCTLNGSRTFIPRIIIPAELLQAAFPRLLACGAAAVRISPRHESYLATIDNAYAPTSGVQAHVYDAQSPPFIRRLRHTGPGQRARAASSQRLGARSVRREAPLRRGVWNRFRCSSTI